jgi:hypothetical protein
LNRNQTPDKNNHSPIWNSIQNWETTQRYSVYVNDRILHNAKKVARWKITNDYKHTEYDNYIVNVYRASGQTRHVRTLQQMARIFCLIYYVDILWYRESWPGSMAEVRKDGLTLYMEICIIFAIHLSMTFNQYLKQFIWTIKSQFDIYFSESGGGGHTIVCFVLTYLLMGNKN